MSGQLTSTCSQCGRELNSASKHCAACLFELLPRDRKSPSPSLPAASEIAGLVTGYTIQELLGSGAIGAVYRARHHVLEHDVAIKILTGGGLKDEHTERFLREGKALAKLSHPNIVGIHDFFYQDDIGVLIMEYITGEDLATYLDEVGSPNHEEAIDIVRQIASGLAYAHRNRIVHRDLKPANILRQADGTVKIVDFGLAIDHSQDSSTAALLTKPGTVLGTLQYMAPEQHGKAGRVDHRADIYSLGVIAYQLLTGVIPAGHFRPPSAIGHSATPYDAIVLKALAQNPDDRFQSAEELLTALETGKEAPLPKATQPNPVDHPATGRAGANRGAALTIGALAITAVLAVMLSPLFRPNPLAEEPPGPAPTTPPGTPPAMANAIVYQSPNGTRFVAFPYHNSNCWVATTEVTRSQWMAYHKAIGSPEPIVMYSLIDDGDEGDWGKLGFHSLDPGFPQQESHPIVGISIMEAMAYCQWLTGEEKEHIPDGWSYQLPTIEHSRLYKNAADGISKANLAGTEQRNNPQWPLGRPIFETHEDRFLFTAPVGAFPPNEQGLHDIDGNVSEWSYSPHREPDQRMAVMDTSWAWGDPKQLGISNVTDTQLRLYDTGFRVTLVPDS